MSHALGELRYAARTLRRTPGFTAMAVAAVALGIGACTAIFSVVNKVLLEPLPYPDPDRLVQLKTTSLVGDQSVVSIPKFLVWRDHTTVFRYVAAYDKWRSRPMNARNNRILSIVWAVRAAGTFRLPALAIQQELHQASGGLPLGRIRTMHEVVAASSARTQFYMMLLTVFAGIALLLAAVGLYGVMAYLVQQRTQEIGIRMALGAGPHDVRNMVVWQGMRLAMAGVFAGIPTALAVTRVMVSMIFGVRTWDPAVFAAVALLLSVVALSATYLPSLRATLVDPADALRSGTR